MTEHKLDHAQTALIQIIRTSKAALDVATADLKAEPTPAALDRVSQEADVLSSAIASLARSTDLENLAPPAPTVILDDGVSLEVGERVVGALENGLCDACGGVLSE